MPKPDTIKIDEVEYIRKDKAGSQPVDFSSEYHPYELGTNYCVRTVTMIQTGRLIAVFDQELVLERAAWIADTGSFSDFLAGKVEPNEVEPFPPGPVIINRGAIVDCKQIARIYEDQK